MALNKIRSRWYELHGTYSSSFLFIIIVVFFLAGIINTPLPLAITRHLTSLFIKRLIIFIVIELRLVHDQILHRVGHLDGTSFESSMLYCDVGSSLFECP